MYVCWSVTKYSYSYNSIEEKSAYIGSNEVLYQSTWMKYVPCVLYVFNVCFLLLSCLVCHVLYVTEWPQVIWGGGAKKCANPRSFRVTAPLIGNAHCQPLGVPLWTYCTSPSNHWTNRSPLEQLSFWEQFSEGNENLLDPAFDLVFNVFLCTVN